MHIHFVTGRLAETALRRQVARLAEQLDFQYTIDVLPITVAALMTPDWIARHITVAPQATRVLLPGYCEGDLTQLAAKCPCPIERGPRDLRRLPEYFGQAASHDDYGEYTIEIIAEINHCPQRSRGEIVAIAERLIADGADVIDVGCEPGTYWPGVGDTVAALRDRGCRVSIDSFDPREVEAAVAAGSELVLSVNSHNVAAAADWGVEVIAIPDEPKSLARFDATIAALDRAGVRFRIDPILEPIGFGFAASLRRYAETRERYPETPMMMGIGNLTELTDVDSAGVNVMLLGVCEELAIGSVLTTQVINWARTSVRECDLARRLVHHAVAQSVLPKHLEPRLVMLRDTTVTELTSAEIAALAAAIRDHNYRIFVAGGRVHLVTAGVHLSDTTGYGLMRQLLTSGPDGGCPKNVDASHAYYLGYEVAKAVTALTLGKQYEQDEPLDWGFLTREEKYR